MQLYGECLRNKAHLSSPIQLSRRHSPNKGGQTSSVVADIYMLAHENTAISIADHAAEMDATSLWIIFCEK